MTTTFEASVLAVDDQLEIGQALKALLRRQGWQVSYASAPEQALAMLAEQDFALVLADMNYSRDTTSGQEGLDLIAAVHDRLPDVPVVAMTAWGSVDLAVSALQAGAVDFVEKPWDNTRLVNIVRTQIERARARSNEQRFRELSRLQQGSQGQVIAESEAMRAILGMVERVAPTAATVLITGENGVGKEVIADLLHRHSKRADQPFVAVNMGSIPAELFESEMFGHERGAFTDAHQARAGRFELADGGTLFLDEIGNLPQAQQAKLLRVLESGAIERVGGSRERQVDVRVIAATNADLSGLVAEGQFRRDLYFRLNTIEIAIPPLRQRPEDIEPLARHFLNRHGARHGRQLALDEQALAALKQHRWPGNVRELSHVIERGVLLSRGGRLDPAVLGLAAREPPSGLGADTVMPLAEAEQLLIRNALARFNGDAEQAAAVLGLSRSAIYRRMQKYGIRGNGEAEA
ncbi:MAG: sigma-54 dependent transcriptional regulator, partial [Wenzhouxiangella sp.]|nr:sigma-54 dependent transcriptional regulator [Wenzhouxiangella sp.]